MPTFRTLLQPTGGNNVGIVVPKPVIDGGMAKTGD